MQPDELYLSALQGGRELICRLDAELRALACLLRDEGAMRVDALYEIPVRNSVSVDRAEPIWVSSPMGLAATDLAVEVLTSIWLRSAQSPRETLRAPGVLAVSDQALAGINRSNQLRMQLFELIRPLEQTARTEIWRAHPAIASLQALRVTPILMAPMALRFYWDTGASIERKQVCDLVRTYDEALLKNYDARPSLYSLPEDSGDRKLVFAISQLEQLPADEQVAIYRPVTPHIRARVRDGDGLPYICSAPVPFVYPLAVRSPGIKPLQNYEPAHRPGKRSIRAQLMEEPYVEAMNIYRYMETHRKFGPVEAKDRTRNKRKTVL